MKTTNYKFLIGILFIFFLNIKITTAQETPHCGTTEITEQLHQQYSGLIQQAKEYEESIQQQIKYNKNSRGAETVYIIPVVFHVLHLNGVENISDARIQNEIAVLNKDYRKLNADTTSILPAFRNIASDIKIEFRLARLDPNGNCTNGIDRIYSHKTNNASNDSKLNQWPRDKYLNVWVINSFPNAQLLGYSNYPSDVQTFLWPYDGVILLDNCIGAPGTIYARTLTHEIGHWINLQHTWGSNNDPEVACGDDGVNDTPQTKGHTNCNKVKDFVCSSQAMAASYNFSSLTNSSGSVDPTTPPNQTNTGGNLAVEFSNFKSVGVSANPTVAGSFGFSGWDAGAPNGTTNYAALTGALNTAKYYEFKVKPTFGQAMTLTGITFKIQRDTAGARTYVVRSSVNNFTSNLAASISPTNTALSIKGTVAPNTNVFFINKDTTAFLAGSKVSLSGPFYTNTTDSITFRIYGFNAENASGTFGIDDVNILGTYGTIENVHNYMEYSGCSYMFTGGQKDRMRAALESNISQRSTLWSAANLIATGTNGTLPECLPLPDFYSNRTNICEGKTITFNKNILRASASNTEWTFVGGTPSTSTANSPTVTYATAGVYPVKLKATNTTGSDSVIKYVTVIDNSTVIPYNAGITDNLQNTSQFNALWQIVDIDNNGKTWKLTNTAGYNSTQSVGMVANGNFSSDVDELITPTYDLNHVTNGMLTFKCAAASKATQAADFNDVLKVYYSKDCGDVWQLGATFQGSTLINNGYVSTNFIPTNSNQWALRTVPIPVTIATSRVRFKFEYTTGNASNNIYIDDININGTVGIDENNLQESSVILYPNPSNQTSTLYYRLSKATPTKIEVLDIMGKKIMEVANSNQSEGDYSFEISKQQLNLKDGIYFVRLSVGSASVNKKLIITN